MKTPWSMIRVDKTTHDRLTAFLNKWKSGRTVKNEPEKFRREGAPTLSAAIEELLDRVDRHKLRSMRAHRKADAEEQPDADLADVEQLGPEPNIDRTWREHLKNADLPEPR